MEFYKKQDYSAKGQEKKTKEIEESLKRKQLKYFEYKYGKNSTKFKEIKFLIESEELNIS